jgi:hypothetical protein
LALASAIEAGEVGALGLDTKSLAGDVNSAPLLFERSGRPARACAPGSSAGGAAAAASWLGRVAGDDADGVWVTKPSNSDTACAAAAGEGAVVGPAGLATATAGFTSAAGAGAAGAGAAIAAVLASEALVLRNL